jgi:hypothetical protein
MNCRNCQKPIEAKEIYRLSAGVPVHDKCSLIVPLITFSELITYGDQSIVIETLKTLPSDTKNNIVEVYNALVAQEEYK